MNRPPITPGPWQRKSDYGDDALTVIANPDGNGQEDPFTYDFIATAVDEYGEHAEAAQANIRAIIALPELLKALVAVAPHGSKLQHGPNVSISAAAYEAVLDALLAAGVEL
jgi:hypothetical protein